MKDKYPNPSTPRGDEENRRAYVGQLEGESGLGKGKKAER